MKNLTFLIFTITFLFLSGCKKNDHKDFQNQKTPEELRSDALQKLRETVEKNPSLKKIKVPVGEQVEGYFTDRDLNKITSLPRDPISGARLYACADPIDLDYPPSSTLESYSYVYDCNDGYKFTFNWKVSISVNILQNDPNSSAVSRGRVKVTSSLGTVYSDLNLTPISITDLGDDPATANDNILYGIEYETDWIPASYLGDIMGTVVVQAGFVAYTDCEEIPYYLAGYKSVTFDGTKACTRIDPLALVSATKDSYGNYITYGSVMGFGNILFVDGCPTPPNYADRYEVELKCIVAGKETDWYPIKPVQGTWPGNKLSDGHLNPFNATTDAGTIGLYDIYYIPERDLEDPANPSRGIAHGDYLIHYRNKMYSPCDGPWSDEFLVEL